MKVTNTVSWQTERRYMTGPVRGDTVLLTQIKILVKCRHYLSIKQSQAIISWTKFVWDIQMDGQANKNLNAAAAKGKNINI